MDRPELFFGLVGAVGTDLSAVADALGRQLKVVGYESEVVRLSRRLSVIDKYRDLPETPIEVYYHKHMKAGTDLRKLSGMNDAMAALGIGAVSEHRDQVSAGDEGEQSDRAYIFRSLKRTEEVDLLRQVYGNGFFLVSAYSPRDNRLVRLTDQIADSHHQAKPDNFRHEAEKLIQTDEAEDDLGVASGQDVRGAFPLADVFIDASSTKNITRDVKRFVEALFNFQFHTPSIPEYGMYLAYAAAWRSADLARQVGAAILTDRGSVIALGPNDVPRAGGGIYWPDDEDDHRDFHDESDSGFTGRTRMLADLLVRLQGAKWLSADRSESPINDLVNEALDREMGGLLRDSQLMDIIEFGRSVHAEMAALTDAAMRGVPLAGTTLYCTTFPCHMCARHIVSSGITRVVYVEPYPKSLAGQMYRDSISIDPSPPRGTRVEFIPFVGVGPNLYPRLFAAGNRKDSQGKVIEWVSTKSSPRIGRVDRFFRDREAAAFDSFSNALNDAKLNFIGRTRIDEPTDEPAIGESG